MKNKVWRHNSFFGYAKMTEKQMQVIQRADTVRPQSKAIAEQIETLSKALYESLKVRVK